MIQVKRIKARMLVKSQVDEIIRLCLLEDLGPKRISVLTGVPFDSVKKVIAGKAYTDWTGGRLVRGRRTEARWRGGTTSYLRRILDEV